VNLTHWYLAAGCQNLATYVSQRPAGAKPYRVALLSFGNISPVFIAMNNNCNAYLKPAISAGKLKLVCQYHLPDFTPAGAQKETEQCLTNTKNGIDAVLTHNDTFVGGVVAALQAAHLQGKVKVFGGYDSTLAGIQALIAGWQQFDQLPPYQQQAWVGAEYLLSKIAKTPPPAGYPNAYYWNGLEYSTPHEGVPALIFKNYFLASAADVQTHIVDTKIYTKAQICAASGVAAGTAWCKAG
jgi:D-xylose transport system substrate-binding protein